MTKTTSFPYKTRELSIPELFKVLQEEYIVCELRARIYPVQRHKDYWSDLMEKKKQKILHLSRNNRFPSIFDNESVRLDFTKRIIPEVGFPNFIYRDDHQRLMQEKWDIHNYYLPGEMVRVDCEDRGKVEGKIKSVDLPNKRIRIQLHGKTEIVQFSLEAVTRIL